MKKLRQFFVFLIISSKLLELNAQNPEIDSLENLLHKHTNHDTIRVNLLNETGNILYRVDIDKTLKYAKEAGELADKLSFTKGKAESLRLIGIYYEKKSKYPEALEYFKKSLLIVEELGDKKAISKCLNNIGIIYWYLGDYFKSLEFYQKSLKISEKIGDKKLVSNCLNNIGLIYSYQSNYHKALEYYEKSLKIYKELGDTSGISYSYNNIGIIYGSQRDYPNALKYFQKSLKIRESIGDKRGISYGCYNIGENYISQGDYSKALEYLKKSLKINVEIGNKSLEALCYVGLSLLYLKLEKPKKAHNYSKKAYIMAKEIKEDDLLKKSSEILAKSSKALGLYKEAYKYHVVFKNLNDSLFNKENTKKITSLEDQYEFEKEKQAIELEQQKKDAVHHEEAKRQKIVRNYLIVGFILLLMVVLLVFRSFLQKRKANRILAAQKSKIEEKNKELLNLNTEIQGQNDLIQLNTKMIIKFERDRVEMDLACKQKDVELLHMNNQLKIKMKNDLIKELQNLKRKKSDIVTGIQSIVNKLKYQIDEETKIDLLQDNIDVVGADFHDRIKQRFQDLSKSEIELLSFIKLRLTNKQIAIQKDTSPNTINVALHRLKTKCDFDSTNDLKNYVEGF